MSKTPLTLLLSLSLMAGVASSAAAQPPTAPPIDSVSGLLDSSPRSLTVHPSLAGWINGGHLTLGITRRPSPDSHALWFRSAWGTGSGFGAFYGVELHQSPHSYLRTQLGVSAGNRFVAFGVARQWAVAFSGAPNRDHAWTLSLSDRLGGWFGTSLRWHLPTHDYGSREILGAVAFRPPRGRFGLELGAGLTGVDYSRYSLHLNAMLGINSISHVYINNSWREADDSGLDLALMAGLRFGAGRFRVGGELISADSNLGGNVWFDLSARRRTPLRSLSNIVLERELGAAVAETPRRSLLGGDSDAFTDTLIELDDIARGPDIGVYLLRLGSPRLGLARALELRGALDRVVEAGVDVWVYLESASLTNLLVASAATIVAASPATVMDAGGISRTYTYLGDTLRAFGIQPQFVRIAEYKTAPEPLLLSSPSEAERTQTDVILDQFWETILAMISEGRELPLATLETFFEQAPAAAPQLLSAGLVDELVSLADLRPALRQAYRSSHLRFISERPNQSWAGDRWYHRQALAILHIEGSIVTGGSFRDPFTGSTFTGNRTIHEIADTLISNPYIRSVIIRIDSPGGSAYASEQMQQALLRLSEAKPTYVSMANMAASGGYYAASIDAPIYVSSATLTGSIGIFAGRVSFDELLRRFDVEVHRSSRGGPSGLYDLPGLAWTQEEEAAIFRQMSGLYALFLERVASARGLDVEEADAVARGRVWTGQDALRVGLADSDGGFLAALDAARSHLSLHAYEPLPVVHVGSPRGPFMGRSLVSAASAALGLDSLQTTDDSPLPSWWAFIGSMLPPDTQQLVSLLVLEQYNGVLAWQPLGYLSLD